MDLQFQGCRFFSFTLKFAMRGRSSFGIFAQIEMPSFSKDSLIMVPSLCNWLTRS